MLSCADVDVIVVVVALSCVYTSSFYSLFLLMDVAAGMRKIIHFVCSTFPFFLVLLLLSVFSLALHF